MHRYPQLFVDTPFLFLGLEYSRFNNLLASTADHENAEGIVSLTTARNSIRSSLTWIECDLIYLAINSLFQQLDQSSSFIGFSFLKILYSPAFVVPFDPLIQSPKKIAGIFSAFFDRNFCFQVTRRSSRVCTVLISAYQNSCHFP